MKIIGRVNSFGARLGTQTAEPGLTYMLNPCVIADGPAWYNPLTGEAVVVEDPKADFPKLVQKWFFVPQNFDIKSMTHWIRQKTLSDTASVGRTPKTSYTIFTTTACNASCSYCFEKGMETITMSDKTATVTVTDNATIYYKNTLLQGEANLTISKTVEDLATGSTAGDFIFEVSGLTASRSYDYTPQTYDTTTSAWVDGTATNQPADAEGKLTFTLQHNKRVVVKIPVGTDVTVTETNSNGFTPNYRITHGDGEPGNSASSNTATITMNGHKTIDFTNTKGVVAPTNFSSRHTPFLLLLLLGLMLLIGGVVAVKRRRGDDPDDGGTLAINPKPLDSGPQPGNVPPPPTTYSATDTQNHVMWRNSVWVEETHTPPQMRRTDISCPQVKLWMTSGGGDAG